MDLLIRDVPDGFITIDEICGNLKLGKLGDRITDYDVEDLDEAFMELADGAVSIYDKDLLDWIPDNVEYIDDVLMEIIFDTDTDSPFMNIVMMAQYNCYLEELQVNRDDIIEYAILQKIKEDGVYAFSEDAWNALATELFSAGLDDINCNYSNLKDKIQEMLDDFVEKEIENVPNNNCSDINDPHDFISINRVNNVAMSKDAVRRVNECGGYEAAFKEDWNQYLPDAELPKITKASDAPKQDKADAPVKEEVKER